jgi:hypothetical protein
MADDASGTSGRPAARSIPIGSQGVRVRLGGTLLDIRVPPSGEWPVTTVVFALAPAREATSDVVVYDLDEVLRSAGQVTFATNAVAEYALPSFMVESRPIVADGVLVRVGGSVRRSRVASLTEGPVGTVVFALARQLDATAYGGLLDLDHLVASGDAIALRLGEDS